MQAVRFLDRDLLGWPILADRHRAKRDELGFLNARLARFCGVSAFPENSVVHDIRAAILGLRGKSKAALPALIRKES